MFKNTFQSGFLSILYSIGSKPLQIWDKTVNNGHIKRITDNDIQSSVLEIMSSNISTTYITCPSDAQKTLGIKLPFLVMIIKNLKKYFTFEVQVLDDKNVRRRFRASNYQVRAAPPPRCRASGMARSRIGRGCPSVFAGAGRARCAHTRMQQMRWQNGPPRRHERPADISAPGGYARRRSPFRPLAASGSGGKEGQIRRFPLLRPKARSLAATARGRSHAADRLAPPPPFARSQSTTRVKPFICTMPMRLDEGWNQIQFNLSDFTRRAYGTNYIETLRVQIHANCRIRRIYFSDRLYSEEELPPEFKLFLPIQKQQAAGEYK